ncbi:MAG: hypothetical protein JXM68_05860 [Sedimentisphaerales bacterium]|nr:hypothetical protein [Sedimentisphaerales bacterium]
MENSAGFKWMLKAFAYLVLAAASVGFIIYSKYLLVDQVFGDNQLTAPQRYNTFEVFLWSLFALISAFAAVHKLNVKLLALAIAFALFGQTDVVENQTGAWWRPWWLMLWKGGCIAAIFGLIYMLCPKKVKDDSVTQDSV